jgi:DNA-binding NarL/FixJ family response regulator
VAKPVSTEVLSQREMEVLRLGVQGLINKEVAGELSVGIRTVQTHWRNIFNKLGVSSRTETIIYALRKGWVSLDPNTE